MTEFEKMRNKEFYDFSGSEIMDSIRHANLLCAKLQTMTLFDEDYRKVIEVLIPGIPASSCINPPFHCDHGHGIKLGEGVFVNYGGTMLDGGLITIGSRTKIGPNCQLVTPNHPIDYRERRKPTERCLPITIGEDCWLGTGVTVCPGVTIGDRCIIGAGSVVVKDIPSDSMAVGNPARVIKNLEIKEDNAEKLLEELFATFKEKGYTSEDFYGGCALCGDANDFALDIIDEAVLKALPDVDKFERDRLTSKLYSQLHQRFEQEEQ